MTHGGTILETRIPFGGRIHQQMSIVHLDSKLHVSS